MCMSHGTSSRRFKHIEPSLLQLTEKATSIAFLHRSSGWFDCTEPSLTTLLQGLLGGVLETPQTRAYHRRSGWFDCTEPSLATSLQEKQGVQGTSVLLVYV